MIEIIPQEIISFTSEDELYPALNLLSRSSECQWKCRSSLENQASVEFQFDTLTKIARVEIGNSGSALIEIQVSRKSEEKNYQVLLGSTSFMTPSEAIKCENLNRVRCFKESNFTKYVSCEKWNIVKVVCNQPFNKTLQYGLSFIKFFGEINDEISIETEKIIPRDPVIDFYKLMEVTIKEEQWRPGSLFEQRNISDKPQTMSDSSTSKQDTQAKTSEAGSQISKVKSEKIILRRSSPPKLINAPSCVEFQNDIKKKRDNPLSVSIDSPTIKKCKVESSVKTTSEHQITKIISPTPCGYTTSTKFPTQQIQSTSSSSNPNPDISNDNVLSNVVFVLSGYQNPLRNRLRDKALSLGAKYRPSWTNDCTHLICAYNNTPKFQEVLGKGIIVSEKWILDCFKEKKLLPWKNYLLKGATSPAKITTNNKHAVVVPFFSTSNACQSSASMSTAKALSQNASINIDKPSYDDHCIVAYNKNTNDFDSLPQLPTVFASKHFFFYGNFDEAELRFLKRLIISFGGHVEDYMSLNVRIIVTNCFWDDNFDEAIESHSDLKFVKPSWLHKCDEEGFLASFEDFEIKK